MEVCNLEDLGFWGSKYTWCNMRAGGQFIKETLDRATANVQWRDLFPVTKVEVLASRCSDHTPLLITFQQTSRRMNSRHRRFMYEAMWGKQQQARDLIKKVWRVKTPGVRVWREVCCKIENSKQEDLQWRQRAKEHWLKQGDKNSKFFHASVKQRRRTNKISSILDERGQLHNNPDAVEGAFIQYYTSLFTSTMSEGTQACLEPLPRSVSEGMNENLLRMFTKEEICAAISQMAPLKSPGPDGLPVCFYQDNWSELGDEVCEAALQFFNSGILEENVNFTHIALIPKIRNPTRVTEFRPISLCNVLYKTLSKVLANRLKTILPHIISGTQSAFIPGRLISDNILAAYETLHTMHSHMWGRVGYMALKLDMSKAYDRVEWGFLEEVMTKMRFASRWVGLIMACITSVKYSIIINGQPVGHISPSRGIRQGDPLSPYLFLLCAEVLSCQFQRAAVLGQLRGVPTSLGGPRLNHLFFADDSLIFCKASPIEWQCLSDLLDAYEKASGQRLNKDKITVFFSRNTSREARECILNLTGIPVSHRYDKYLGLPALVGKSRVGEFRNIIDRASRRVSDWKMKFLSLAGKEILLKAVIQAIPTYSMSIFFLPKTLCRELNNIMQKFWWGHRDNDKKIHWMSWEKMGFAKNKGGMGFRDLMVFNKALLARQCWRLLQFPESLVGQIIKAKYFPRGSLLRAKLGSRPSYAWQSLLSAKDVLTEGLLWRIGDGKSVRIWGDKWLPTPTTFEVQSPCMRLAVDARVESLIDWNLGGWNTTLIYDIFLKEEAEIICNIPISRYGYPDKLIWRANTSGMFTVRSGYHMEKERHALQMGEGSRGSGYTNLWKKLWQLQVPNAAKVFLWRACSNILPTKDNLLKRKIVKEDGCIFCCRDTESVVHILWECPSATDVWSVSCRSLQKSHDYFDSFMDVFAGLVERSSIHDLNLFALTAKRIWARRNTVIHGGEFLHPCKIAQEAESMLSDYHMALGVTLEGEGRQVVRNVVKWKNPPVGYYKMNWDMALDNIHKCMGFGMIARDDQGNVIAAQSKHISAIQAPVVGEAMAALEAVEFSREVGLQDVILEGDSLQVVQALQKTEQNWIPYGHIVEDARLILNTRRNWPNLLVCAVKTQEQSGCQGLQLDFSYCEIGFLCGFAVFGLWVFLFSLGLLNCCRGEDLDLEGGDASMGSVELNGVRISDVSLDSEELNVDVGVSDAYCRICCKVIS
ncbi:uncharacterized protein LOC132169234 [Corylus avellana]|uniref:uncharacterized protein LOC132169234 n=1 Tax=Corylus avellana TaxID=13451 RepID=UPI00286C792D|nr:uncharacterized protein LOC132169234 [Corylus avellana]